MTTPSTIHQAPEILRRALPYVARIKANYAEYLRERQEAGGWLDYCKHGTYIGSWWGPDYLCGYCEDGDPAWIYRAAIHAAHRDMDVEAQRRKRIDTLYGLLVEHPQFRTFINAELSHV